MSDVLAGSLLAFLSALAYAVHYFLIRVGFRAGDPDGGAFVATISSTVLLGAAAAVSLAVQPVDRVEPTGLVWFAVAGALGPFGGRVLLFAGIHRIGAVRSAAIANAGPLITVMLAVVLLGERLSPGAVAAVALVVGGVGMLAVEAFRGTTTIAVILPRSGEGTSGVHPQPRIGPWAAVPATRVDPRQIGQRLTTAAVLGFSAALVAATAFSLGRTSQRLGLVQLPDPLIGAAVASGVGLVMHVLRLAVLRRLRAAIRVTVRQLRPALWVAGALAALGLLAFFAALTLAPLSTVAIVSASEAVLVVVLGVLTMRRAEGVTALVAAAACCVFAAGVLVSISH